MRKEQAENTALFTDANGEAVFPQDAVQLHGRQKKSAFNGRRGGILGADPKCTGRYAVQISSDGEKFSFQPKNLLVRYLGESSEEKAVLQTLSPDPADALFAGLLERTREVDLLQYDIWSHLTELYGKCPVICCLGYLARIP